MERRFEFNEEKNLLLKESRGVNFEDILVAITEGNILDDLINPGSRYKNQRILVVKINRYAYAVPYVIQADGTLFLKTVYPSRVLTKHYLK